MLTALVIDDDAPALRVLQRLLFRCGYDAVGAASGIDGLRAASTTPIDLVITDLRLPDLDGVEVIRRLRRNGVLAPVILLTGYPSIPSAVDAVSAGAADYLEKPITSDGLQHALAKALATNIDNLSHPSDGAPPATSWSKWGQLVIAGAHSTRDPATLGEWARHVGSSPGTIKRLCAALGITTKDSRDFTRLLRAVLSSVQFDLPMELFLEIDPRTLQDLLRRAGLPSDGGPGSVHTPQSRRDDGADRLGIVDRFLLGQTLITNRLAIEAIRALLRQHARHPGRSAPSGE